MIRRTWSLILIASMTFANSAMGDIIVQWDFSDNSGASPAEPVFFEAANISGVDFDRGAGLSAHNETGGFSSTGWGTTDSSDYLTFGMTVDSGYQMQLDSLLIRTQSTTQGPGTLGLYFSGDGFSSPLHVFSQGQNTILDTMVDLTGLGSLTGSVEFRLMEIGNTSAKGTGSTNDSHRFIVSNHGGSTPVTFNGTISAVPEPNSLWMTAFLCGGVWYRRRHRSGCP